MYFNSRTYRTALLMAVAIPLAFVAHDVSAQQSDLGSVTVNAAPKPVRKKTKPTPKAARAKAQEQKTTPNTAAAVAPLKSDAAIGSGAPQGSAPALAPSQSSLNAFQPVSIVSDKIIKDVVPAGADYNETAKYTPGFLSNNANGIGDSKSGWRGYQDGQFNITFDGIPFGDANDPTHHSAAYFPASFLSRVTVDRGPGSSSQVGYATFGGTMGLNSLTLADKAGGTIGMSYGNHNTFTTSVSAQSGYDAATGTRALVAFSHIGSDGQLQFGDSSTNQGLIKVEKQFGEVKITALATGGTERYTNVNSITWPQFLAHGVNYGQVNDNPRSTQYAGYNNSLKATDMEYVRADWNGGDIRVDNTVYSYSYWYPRNQNNGIDQTIEGNASVANKGTLRSVTFPSGGTSYLYSGVTDGDVTGYYKINSYRAFGDILNVAKDVNIPMFAGTFRTGMWVEHISNDRAQQYVDYTTGKTYDQIGGLSSGNVVAPTGAAYKLDLNSKIVNVQPFMEYEWRVTDRLSVTPGYKFESFTRDHTAVVNQTTLTPIAYKNTYTANLPFLAARYKLNDEVTVYAQASKGFLAPTVSAYYVTDPSLNKIEPQSTTNYQVGAVYKTQDITLAANIYRVTATNFPITTVTNGLTTYENGGTARYQGIEAEGTYALFNGLAAYASGALMSAKYTTGAYSGLRVGNAPSHTFATGLIYDDQTYFASLLQKFTGDYYGSGGQKASTIPVPGLNKVSGYNTTDFVAGVRSNVLKKIGLGERAEFKLGVSNIFNHRNITDIGGDPTTVTAATAYSTSTKMSYSFMPGRTIYGSVKIDF